jgi:hypothetical protein
MRIFLGEKSENQEKNFAAQNLEIQINLIYVYSINPQLESNNVNLYNFTDNFSLIDIWP